MRWRVLFVYLAMLLTMGFALPYWAHPLDHQLWVKMNVTPGYEGYYVYYNGTKDYSNGTATFWFFDDFSTWSGWIKHLSGVVSQDTTTFPFPTLRKDLYGDPSGGYKPLPSLLNFPFVAQAGIDRTYLSGANADRFGVVDSSGNGYGFIFSHPNAIGYDVRTGYVATYTPLVGLASDIYQKWYIGRLTWQNGNIGVELRDSSNNLVAKGAAYNTAYSSFNDVYVFGGYRYFLSYLFVAKYNETAPVVFYGPEEKGSWVIGGQTYTRRRFLTVDYHGGNVLLKNFQIPLNYYRFNSTNISFVPESFVSFVSPTPVNGSERQVYNVLRANVAAATPLQNPQVLNVSTITIHIYNASTNAEIVSRTCTVNGQSSNCTLDYFLSGPGKYKVNATAVLTDGQVLHTETRTYTVSPTFPYWQDKRDKELWVKVSLKPGKNTFYIYYNSSKSYSNPNKVFLFFDDFNGTSLNLSKWTTSAISLSTARYSVENSYLNMSYNWGVCCSGGCIYSHLNTLKSFKPPFVVESRFMPTGAISLASGYQICYHTIFANVDAIGISSNVDAFSFRYGSSYKYFSLPPTVPQLDVWHRTTEIFSPSELSVKTDYITTPYTYGYTTALSGPIGLAGDTDLLNGYDLVDWIAVRNYTFPEPTVSYGRVEKGTWTINGVVYHDRRVVYIDSLNSLSSYQIDLNYSVFDLQNVCVQYGEGVVWSPPTPTNNTYEFSVKTVLVNATASSYPFTYVKSIKLTIYNKSGVVDSYTCTYSAGSTQSCVHDLTVKRYGTYYINATAAFGVGQNRTTRVRTIHFVRSKPYWADKRDGEVWFKSAFLPGQNVFYIYYNSSKSYSNPNKVFLFFDDFNGTSLNLSKWTTSAISLSTARYSVENSYLNMSYNWGGCCNGVCIYSHLNTLKSFKPPFVVESRFMPTGAISLTSGYEVCYHTIFANVDAIGISSNVDAFSFRYGTSYTYYSFPPTEPKLAVWHRTTEIFSPSELSIKTDYITTPYTYGYTTALSGPIGLAGDTDLLNGYDLVDWIAVRNYTSPEPKITGIGSVEKGTWVVDGVTYHNRRLLVTYSIQYLPVPYQIKFNYTTVNDTNLSIVYVGKYARPPTIAFASPTPADGTTLYQPSFNINITFGYSDNATIHILDLDDGTRLNMFCTSSPCNITITKYGHYKFNATACNGIGCNATENRTVTLSNGTVFLTFNPPTPDDGAVATQPVQINITATAVPGLANITLDVSNSSTVVLHQLFFTSPATAVLVLLKPGTYTIKATGCNTLKVCNTSTSTFTIPAPPKGCTLYIVVRNMDITPLRIDYVLLDGQKYLVNQTLGPLEQRTLKIVNKSICYYYVLGKHDVCTFTQLGFIYERNGLIMMLPPAEYPICAVLEDESG